MATFRGVKKKIVWARRDKGKKDLKRILLVFCQAEQSR
jgi:hypothetical protein